MRRASIQSPRCAAAHHRHRFVRERAGESRHPAARAEQQAFERHVVEPGEQREAIAEAIDDVGEAARIGRAFLDRHDVRESARAAPAFRARCDTRYAGGLLYSMIGSAVASRDRAEVRVQLLGRRHVHHRRQHHQRVDADLLGVARELDGAIGVELGNAGDQRHAPADRFDARHAAPGVSPRAAANCSRRPCRAAPGRRRHPRPAR